VRHANRVSPTQEKSGTLVLLRHGQSEWNRDGRFTGWTDVDLSPRGVEEAEHAGRVLRANGHTFDLCFASVLRRAERTARIVLDTMDLPEVAIRQSWRLNERHYGALQGLRAWGAMRRYGPLPVMRSKRVYSYRPPALAPDDPRHPGGDPLYTNLEAGELPHTESLKDTLLRLLPYWEAEIAPALRAGKRVLLVSHKNTLRVLIKLIEGRRETDVARIRAPTCTPLVFELDAQLRPRRRAVLRPGQAAPRLPAAARG
jgi:2,3-bisphosphoglycerate-dependent phosphoglycerate mutase